LVLNKKKKTQAIDKSLLIMSDGDKKKSLEGLLLAVADAMSSVNIDAAKSSINSAAANSSVNIDAAKSSINSAAANSSVNSAAANSSVNSRKRYTRDYTVNNPASI